MDDTESQHLADLLQEYPRRLRPLEKQAVRFGIRTDPHVLNEIEDIQDEIIRIENKLGLTKTQSEQVISSGAHSISTNRVITFSRTMRTRLKFVGINQWC